MFSFVGNKNLYQPVTFVLKPLVPLRLSQDGHGIVMKGRHKASGQVVALKKVLLKRLEDGIPETALREIVLYPFHGISHSSKCISVTFIEIFLVTAVFRPVIESPFLEIPIPETRFGPIHGNLLWRLCNWLFEQNHHIAQAFC